MRSFFYAGYPFCKQNHTLIATKSYTYCKNHQKPLLIPQKCCTFAPKLNLCHYYVITMKLVCDYYVISMLLL